MKIRFATTDDLDVITRLEERALPILTPYVAVAQDYYFERAKGEILLVEKEDTPVAMGRFTVMPDETIWIETIRVDPDHQRQGIGKLIYTEIEKIAKEMNIPKMAMYTEAFNEGSMALVQQMEFDPYGVYSCYRYDLDGEYPDTDFRPVVSIDEIHPILESHNWEGKISLNRTFYDMNKEILEEFIRRGDLYTDGNSLLLEGNRTRENGEQSMGLYLGDIPKCIDAGISLTHKKGLDTILAIFPKEREDILEILKDKGFEDTYDLHVFEKHLD